MRRLWSRFQVWRAQRAFEKAQRQRIRDQARWDAGYLFAVQLLSTASEPKKAATYLENLVDAAKLNADYTEFDKGIDFALSGYCPGQGEK